MASRDQLRKIAVYCDKYNMKRDDEMSLKSGSLENRESCTNCTHYVSRRCELNLIDKVLSAMSMDTNLKS
ncbi:hypothetical protein E9840_04190 [Tissierella creatinini]|nr:hypothetical protein E9840_04190 [Tissierella creatinini]TJX66350.1 hypothetical protein E8P77_08145 [Soehngenia saccharolytica]